MYLIYGRENCTNCIKIKNKLVQNNHDYEYKDIDKIPKTEKFDLLKLAKTNKQMSLPIVFEDDTFVLTMELESILDNERGVHVESN